MREKDRWRRRRQIEMISDGSMLVRRRNKKNLNCRPFLFFPLSIGSLALLRSTNDRCDASSSMILYYRHRPALTIHPVTNRSLASIAICKPSKKDLQILQTWQFATQQIKKRTCSFGCCE